MDDRDEFRGTRTDSGAQLKQPFTFVLFEKDLFQRNSLAEHDIFSFEEFYLPTQFVFGTSGEIEQKWGKPTGHELISFVLGVEKKGDILFEPLRTSGKTHSVEIEKMRAALMRSDASRPGVACCDADLSYYSRGVG